MKKKYPIRQTLKVLPDIKSGCISPMPPVKQQVAFFRRCGKRKH